MVRIRPMTDADVALGMRLATQANWNQLPGDWRRLLALQADGCFVAEWNGVAVGTTVACLFDRVAWLAMVLIEEPFRGRGIGNALLRHALAFVDERGVRSVRLDATALGQPLYERQGFQPQYMLTRFAGRLPPAQGERAPRVRAADPADYPRLLALDRQVTRTDRGKFLHALLGEDPASVRVVEQGEAVVGWMTVRRGRQAWQLGPCLAETQAGEELLDDVAARLSGEEVFLDAPATHEHAIRWAEQAGLIPQRQFVRMCRGESIDDDIDQLWGSSGPELG